jgi:hypothetical protein
VHVESKGEMRYTDRIFVGKPQRKFKFWHKRMILKCIPEELFADE